MPTAAYAQALHYNRTLFTAGRARPEQAADDVGAGRRPTPSRSPQKTGKAGYAEMGKDDNTAGWILTTLVYALGGRMETGTGTKAKATLNNPQTVHGAATC